VQITARRHIRLPLNQPGLRAGSGAPDLIAAIDRKRGITMLSMVLDQVFTAHDRLSVGRPQGVVYFRYMHLYRRAPHRHAEPRKE